METAVSESDCVDFSIYIFLLAYNLPTYSVPREIFFGKCFTVFVSNGHLGLALALLSHLGSLALVKNNSVFIRTAHCGRKPVFISALQKPGQE